MTRLRPFHRLVLAALVASGLALSGAGCVAPSFPLPPPDPSLITFHTGMDMGTPVANVTYTVPRQEYVGGKVSIFDRQSGEGTITTTHTDGSFASRNFPAKDGDQVEIVVSVDEKDSGICLVLHEGASSEAFKCP